jgi:hypothetical protein
VDACGGQRLSLGGVDRDDDSERLAKRRLWLGSAERKGERAGRRQQHKRAGDQSSYRSDQGRNPHDSLEQKVTDSGRARASCRPGPGFALD